FDTMGILFADGDKSLTPEELSHITDPVTGSAAAPKWDRAARTAVFKAELMKYMDPQDRPAFLKGLVKGFFEDGFVGSVKGIGDLLQEGVRLSPVGSLYVMTFGDRYAKEQQ